jgi:hypothetical protein
MDNQREFRTADLALAAWLRCNDVEHSRFIRRGRECVWIYEEVNRLGMAALILEFVSGEARVEPKAFALKLGLVRTEMYKFMGRGGHRREHASG